MTSEGGKVGGVILRWVTKLGTIYDVIQIDQAACLLRSRDVNWPMASSRLLPAPFTFPGAPISTYATTGEQNIQMYWYSLGNHASISMPWNELNKTWIDILNKDFTLICSICLINCTIDLYYSQTVDQLYFIKLRFFFNLLHIIDVLDNYSWNLLLCLYI